MVGSPLTVNAFQVEVTCRADKNVYQRGMPGLFVFGWCTFGDGTYWESPQFINFEKMWIYPRNKSFTVFKWQMKPNCSLSVKPVYGNYDTLVPATIGGAINLVRGVVDGLKPLAADGSLGSAPPVVDWHGAPPPT